MNDTVAKSNDQGKRDFLKYFLGGSLTAWVAAVVYPLIAYLKPPKQAEVEVSNVKVALTTMKKEEGMIVRFGNKPVILIRTASDEFKAFTATCTHLDCTVQFRKDLNVIWCACHNGKYDLNGRNISGPPPRPLGEFRVTRQGDDVIISKIV
ncbi:MAG TPA: ubiquinol-cytochrome c reductase iron-sulfur subunit [Bacteroidota bacterium]|jgi:Rieske Fe-S protein